MAKEMSPTLEKRWEAFAKRHGLGEFKATLIDENEQETLIIKMSPSGFARAFDGEEDLTSALDNYGLQLQRSAEGSGLEVVLFVTRGKS